MANNKAIYFDMDGTLADLYNVPSWLDMLIAEDATPYEVAKPMLNLSRLARTLNKLQQAGYTIGIISWGSKNSTAEYLAKVAEAKREWLRKHLPSVTWDEIHIVKYGTSKASVCRESDSILFDDEERNIYNWPNDYGFYPNQIFTILNSLLKAA